MIYDIVKYPNEILVQENEEITEFDDKLKCIVRDIIYTMYANEGAGIAAPQVGINKKIFIIDNIVSKTKDPIVFINPKILELSGSKTTEAEGCLSFGDVKVEIERHNNVKIEARDIDGNLFIIEASGFYARALLHEFDHLNGILMIDHIPSYRRKQIKNKL